MSGYAYSHNELHKNGLPFSWLRTGAQRLVPVPLDLLPWRGPESRATFKNATGSLAQPVVRGRGRR